MEILQKDDGKRGMFYIEVDGETEGVIEYVWAGAQKLIIEHTEVGEKLKGQSAGKKLVNKVVEFAREKQVKVQPLCTFAHAVFEKTPEYSDVRF